MAAHGEAADLNQLHADIAARVLAADPGGRPPDAIARYASLDFIRGMFAYAMGEERRKLAEAAARAAVPIAPKYPRPARPGTRRELEAALDGFVADIRRRARPRLLARVTVGFGKSTLAIEKIPEIIQACRDSVRGMKGEKWLGPLVWAVPLHMLGGQAVADFERVHPHLNVRQWRGTDADNPARPGEKMCRNLDLLRGAEKAGLSRDAACERCPLKAECDYHAQERDSESVDVWVVAHHTLFQHPFGGWPRLVVNDKRTQFPLNPCAIVIDENFVSAGMRGESEPERIPLASLDSTHTGKLSGDEAASLLKLRGAMRDALKAMPDGRVRRAPLLAAGLSRRTGTAIKGKDGKPAKGPDVVPLDDWRELESMARPSVGRTAGLDHDALLARFEEVARIGFSPLRLDLARLARKFLDSFDAESINLSLETDENGERFVRMAWRADMHEAFAARSPMLLLDATASPDVVREWVPGLEVCDIEVDAPHQRVTQITDREFGRRMFTQPGHADDLLRTVLLELAAAKPRTVFLAAQKAAKAMVAERLPERGALKLADGVWRFPNGAVLHLSHFGALIGSNAWKDVGTVVVAGRRAPDCRSCERLAEIIFGRRVALATLGPGGWWPVVDGVCQRSCPVLDQAASLILRSFVSRSGLRQTSPIGDQLRIWRDHRAGLAARASV